MRDDDVEVYEKHADELIRFAGVLVGPSGAEDLFVTAFLRAVAAPRWPAIANQRAYLFRVLVNEAIRTRRATDRRLAREARVAPTESFEPRYSTPMSYAPCARSPSANARSCTSRTGSTCRRSRSRSEVERRRFGDCDGVMLTGGDDAIPDRLVLRTRPDGTTVVALSALATLATLDELDELDAIIATARPATEAELAAIPIVGS